MVAATSLNKVALLQLLKQNGVPSAYVVSGEGHHQLMVLHDNGALAPHDPERNTSEYVLVEGVEDLPESPLLP